VIFSISFRALVFSAWLLLPLMLTASRWFLWEVSLVRKYHL
jgi:hypothetical protein